MPYCPKDKVLRAWALPEISHGSGSLEQVHRSLAAWAETHRARSEIGECFYLRPPMSNGLEWRNTCLSRAGLWDLHPRGENMGWSGSRQQDCDPQGRSHLPGCAFGPGGHPNAVGCPCSRGQGEKPNLAAAPADCFSSSTGAPPGCRGVVLTGRRKGTARIPPLTRLPPDSPPHAVCLGLGNAKLCEPHSLFKTWQTAWVCETIFLIFLNFLQFQNCG